MASRRACAWLLVFAVVGGVPAVAGCSLHDQTPTYRYRVTVEVNTPEGLRTGSSVVEVETQRATAPLNPSAATVRFSVRGEAVAIPLPSERMLFALLRSNNDADWAGRVMLMAAAKQSDGAGTAFDEWFDIRNKRKGRITLPRNWPPGHLTDRSAYPTFVTFQDVADPASVQRVEPDKFAQTFGKGVSLKRITLQLTDDPVTTGITNRLRWLTDPDVMELPGWTRLPREARELLVGLREGKVGSEQ